MASAGGKSKTHRRSLSHPVDATIPTIELPKPKLDLHLQPIKLSSACHDSPMFRKALLKEEVGHNAFSSPECTLYSNFTLRITSDAYYLAFWYRNMPPNLEPI